MITNYFLIDYENVQPEAIDALDRENFRVIVFVGSNQTKIPFEMVTVLQNMGERAKYVKIAGNGSNALDFHIAFYIGELATHEPTAYFHIISEDTGFDPLIEHLKNRKIMARRVPTIKDIPIVKAANASPSEKLTMVINHLQQKDKGKPKTVQALTNTISAIFRKTLSEQDLTSMLNTLQKQGIITINDTKVSYTLPELPEG